MMVRKYTPQKRVEACEHGCGSYTINAKTQTMRRHVASGKACTQAECGEHCTGRTPLGTQLKTLASGGWRER